MDMFARQEDGCHGRKESVMNMEEFWGKMDRRAFLCRMGTAGLAGAGLMLGLAACGGGEDQSQGQGSQEAASTTPADPCSDLSGLSPEEIATRDTFKYQKKADDPAKVCTKCNFWQPPAEGSPCGTCTLVKGPIHPEGTCISWAEVVES
jgi:hypothetical protein